MTMEEIYNDTDKWVREMELEATGYSSDLEDAWKELDYFYDDCTD